MDDGRAGHRTRKTHRKGHPGLDVPDQPSPPSPPASRKARSQSYRFNSQLVKGGARTERRSRYRSNADLPPLTEKYKYITDTEFTTHVPSLPACWSGWKSSKRWTFDNRRCGNPRNDKLSTSPGYGGKGMDRKRGSTGWLGIWMFGLLEENTIASNTRRSRDQTVAGLVEVERCPTQPRTGYSTGESVSKVWSTGLWCCDVPRVSD